LAGFPQLLIDHTERRAAIAADEARRVEPARTIERALHQHEAHERVRARQEEAAAGRGQVAAKPVVGECGCAVRGGVRTGVLAYPGRQTGGHGEAPFLVSACTTDARNRTTAAMQRKRLYFLAPIGEIYC